MDHNSGSSPTTPGLRPGSQPRLRRIGLACLILLSSAPAWGACDSSDPLRIGLSVSTDRGDPGDREQRIQLHASGCLAVQRPPAFREPGLHVGQVPATELAELQAQLNPVALARAEAQLLRDTQALAAEGAPAHYISHPTHYVLSIADGKGGPPALLRFESTLQLAELYPQSTELAEIAAALRAILALDRRPGLRAESAR